MHFLYSFIFIGKISETLIFTKFQISFSACRCCIILHSSNYLPELQRLKCFGIYTNKTEREIFMNESDSSRIIRNTVWAKILVVRFFFWGSFIFEYIVAVSSGKQGCCSLTIFYSSGSLCNTTIYDQPKEDTGENMYHLTSIGYNVL